MRESYHGDLNSVIDHLVSMSEKVTAAVRGATTALLEADHTAAEQVISADAELDAMHDDLDARCFSLLARQAPVAGELRTLVAAMRMVADLARMGDLAAHVAKIARMRYPRHAVPESLLDSFRRMSEIAIDLIAMARRTLRDRDARDAETMADHDEEMDGLRSSQFRVLLAEDWPYTVEQAVDCALLGRYYERIADHAVLMGSRVVYVVTGVHPEGENWTIA